MLAACDGAITSTFQLKEELLKHKDGIAERNRASVTVEISSHFIKDYSQQDSKVKDWLFFRFYQPQ